MSSEEVVKEFLEYRKTRRKDYLKNCDGIERASAECLCNIFENWMPFLTVDEEAVIILKCFKNMKVYQIAMEISFSERQINRILKSAKKKINKVLP